MKIFLLTHLFYLAVSLFLEEHKTVKIIRKEGPSKCCELFLSLTCLKNSAKNLTESHQGQFWDPLGKLYRHIRVDIF